MKFEIINDDGTKFDPPQAPYFKEEWLAAHPPTRNGEPCSSILGYHEDGRPIMNYTCVMCHEKGCPHSDSFEIPDELREEYEQYWKDLYAYHLEHNPREAAWMKEAKDGKQ